MDEQELNSLLICEIENQHIDYRLGNWNNQVAWVAPLLGLGGYEKMHDLLITLMNYHIYLTMMITEVEIVIQQAQTKVEPIEKQYSFFGTCLRNKVEIIPTLIYS